MQDKDLIGEQRAREAAATESREQRLLPHLTHEPEKNYQSPFLSLISRAFCGEAIVVRLPHSPPPATQRKNADDRLTLTA